MGADDFTPDSLRALVRSGRVAVFGEVMSQYEGLAPADPALDWLFSLAEELDVPVGIHVAGVGAPVPGFRAALADPLLLEPVLIRHPRLRLWIMHAGWPFLEETVTLLRRFPEVYVDVSWINWQAPRGLFHDYLERLVTFGFGQRVMFGTDQVWWPDAVDLAVGAIHAADFLTPQERDDILYANAARFFRLPARP